MQLNAISTTDVPLQVHIEMCVFHKKSSSPTAPYWTVHLCNAFPELCPSEAAHYTAIGSWPQLNYISAFCPFRVSYCGGLHNRHR